MPSLARRASEPGEKGGLEQWAASVDFKDDLIEVLDASKFGTREYTPYVVYTKALYEDFKEELGEDAAELGCSAVDLAEFQEDAVKKARRILALFSRGPRPVRRQRG